MKRVVTALFLVPVAVYSACSLPGGFSSPSSPFSRCSASANTRRITESFAPLGYVAGLLILLAPLNQTALIMFLSALAAMCLTLSRTISKRSARAAALVTGIVYIFGAWKTAISAARQRYSRAANTCRPAATG